MTCCGFLALAPVICAGANDTELPMKEGVPALYGNKVFSHHRNGYFYAIE